MTSILVAVVVLMSGTPVKGAQLNVCHQVDVSESGQGLPTDSRGRMIVEVEPGEHIITVSVKMAEDHMDFYTFTRNFTKEQKEVVVELNSK